MRIPILRRGRAVFQDFRVVLIVLCIAFSPAARAQFSLVDTEFDLASDWSQFGPWIDPADAVDTGSFSAEQVLDGGHPGAYLAIVHTNAASSTSGTASWVALINERFSWEPSTLRPGAEAELSFRIDARRPSNTLNRVYTLAVRQDGWVWMATNARVFVQEDGWVEVEIDDLGTLDFFRFPYVNAPGQPVRPDFSQAGSTVHFGIATGLSCPSTSDCSNRIAKPSDIDNLVVTVVEKDAFYINPTLNDAWYYPPTAGQGFFVVVYPQSGIVFLSWFTFDAMRPGQGVSAVLGDPGARWFTAQGPFEVDTAKLQVYLTEGGVLDSIEPKAVTDPNAPIGTMEITWSGCDSAVLAYDILGYSGAIELERVAKDHVAACEASQP